MVGRSQSDKGFKEAEPFKFPLHAPLGLWADAITYSSPFLDDNIYLKLLYHRKYIRWHMNRSVSLYTTTWKTISTPGGKDGNNHDQNQETTCVKAKEKHYHLHDFSSISPFQPKPNHRMSGFV